MKELFYSYFLSFIHPFKIQKILEEGRENPLLYPEVEKNLFCYHGEILTPAASPDIGENILYPFHKKSFLPRPNLLEFTCLSWLFSMIKAMYGLSAISLGYYLLKWAAVKFSITTSFLKIENMTQNKMVLFFLLLEVALFPLGVYLYFKIWELIIRFFIHLYEIEVRNEEKAVEEILSASLCCHIFYIFPIFGEFAKHIASLVYIFSGLRSGLGMSTLQALMVVIAPVFVVLFSLLIIGIYFVVLFAAF